jgi:GMP synthase-like glutamine amidotransferase
LHAHTIQHVPFEGLGSIDPWLKDAGYRITHTRMYSAETLPEPFDFDLLVVMGGPMSVTDEVELPWLVAEKTFIRKAIEAGIAVLGICLGAQLIAASMGARVFPNPHKEIGWLPVQGVSFKDPSHFQFPHHMEVFHWHGETFDLPENAVRLAKSEGCENQAFQLGDSVIGLQFHLETTPSSAQEIVLHCGDECVVDRYVQTKEEILAAGTAAYEKINQEMGRVLSFLCRRG